MCECFEAEQGTLKVHQKRQCIVVSSHIFLINPPVPFSNLSQLACFPD